jgi:cyanophycinase
MLAEGYERGFAFLPGTAIDQHFTQRKRHPDMLAVMAVHPQLLGIGLDETTAIVVRDNLAEVMGKAEVHFFDTRIKTEDAKPTCVSLPAGKKYDLVARKEVTE